jgi:polyphosphate kinase
MAKKPQSSPLLNRELSWLEFNQRVLEEALDRATPLLERVKFFCVFNANLDDFFETRVAGIKQQIESSNVFRSPDGLTASETFLAIQRRVRRLVDRQYNCWRNVLRPALARNGIRFLKVKDLASPDRNWVNNFYRRQVRPVLTPLGLDPAHPFPKLLNKSLNLIVQMRINEAGQARELIGQSVGDLFPGAEILGCWSFRVTRNTELYADEEEAGELLKPVEIELAQPPSVWRSNTAVLTKFAPSFWKISISAMRT